MSLTRDMNVNPKSDYANHDRCSQCGSSVSFSYTFSINLTGPPHHAFVQVLAAFHRRRRR